MGKVLFAHPAGLGWFGASETNAACVTQTIAAIHPATVIPVRGLAVILSEGLRVVTFGKRRRGKTG